MGVLTSQKIAALYERFRDIEVTYSKEITQVTGLQSKQIYLKCVSDVWPCVIFSSSFQGAKVVINIKSGLIPKLQQANNMVSLRFCFVDPFQEGEQITFFVAARSMGYVPYGETKDAGLLTIQFTQRPPDDLIEIMGRLLDANVNSTRRKGERILITSEILRKLKIHSSECAVFIQGVPRRCILRDISFGGARLIIQGVVKFLLEKEASLRIDFDDPRENFLLKGKFTQAENVAYRKDMAIINLAFSEGQIPMGYKMRINEYMVTVRGAAAEGESPAKASPQGEASPGKTAPGENFSVDEEKDTAKNLGGVSSASPAAPVKSPTPAEKSSASPAAPAKSPAPAAKSPTSPVKSPAPVAKSPASPAKSPAPPVASAAKTTAGGKS
ncbi:MAG: pilus assembly protein PilZ [Treponema sp.]|jgi:hypothetical protein|nr:pilus assembly protein PilZ [Treponema sp.]